MTTNTQNNNQTNSKREVSKSQLTNLYELFRATMDTAFYGSVEVKFEAGKVSVIKKTESIKL